MEIFIKFAAIAVIGCICSLCVKKEAPQIAFLVSIAAGIVIIHAAVGYFSDLAAEAARILSNLEINFDFFKPVAKLLCISVVSKITAGICNDSGHGALATNVETVYAIAAIAVTLPLAAEITENLSSLFGKI